MTGLGVLQTSSFLDCSQDSRRSKNGVTWPKGDWRLPGETGGQADVAPERANTHEFSVDHLVRTSKHSWRHGKVQFRGGLRVDCQGIFCGELDREFFRSGAT